MLRWMVCAVAILVALAPDLIAQPLGVSADRSRALLFAGRDQMEAGRMRAAADSFRVLAHRPDGDVAAYHGLATAALYQAFFTENEAYFERFYARADTLDRYIEAMEEGKGKRLARAEETLMRSLAHGREGSYLRAAWYARTAMKRLEDLEDAYPGYADAQFALGLIHFFVGVLPRREQWVLSVLGFTGDAKQGWRELETAVTESRLNRFPATAVLAIADLMLFNRSKAALDRLDALRKTHPESVIVDYLVGYALLNDHQAGRAAQLLQQAVDRSQSREIFFVDYLDYYLAEARMLQGRYSEAARLFRRYLGRHQGAALQATAYLQLGICVELDQSWAQAKDYYTLVSVNRDFDSDQAAQRRAEQHAEDPMTPVERQILRGRFAFDAGRYATADSLLHPLLGDEQLTADQRAEVRYRLARLRHAQERLGKALLLYRAVLRAPGDETSKWGPYSHLYAGDIHAARGDTTEARSAYESAREWPTPYDYSASLDQTARLRLQEINGRSVR